MPTTSVSVAFAVVTTLGDRMWEHSPVPEYIIRLNPGHALVHRILTWQMVKNAAQVMYVQVDIVPMDFALPRMEQVDWETTVTTTIIAPIIIVSVHPVMMAISARDIKPLMRHQIHMECAGSGLVRRMEPAARSTTTVNPATVPTKNVHPSPELGWMEIIVTWTVSARAPIAFVPTVLAWVQDFSVQVFPVMIT